PPTPPETRRHKVKCWGRGQPPGPAINPTLWRLAACLGPGLPRPTKSSMALTAARPPYRNVRYADKAAYAPPHFFSGFAGAAAAAGAAPPAGAGTRAAARAAPRDAPSSGRRAPPAAGASAAAAGRAPAL